MLIKSVIDMGKPNAAYGAGLGLIMLLSLAMSNLPALAFSQYVELAFRRELCAGLFITGAVFGAWALQRHMARAQSPWRVPQSQVSILYCIFFASTLLAVMIAH
jgi:hypothetical protein